MTLLPNARVSIIRVGHTNTHETNRYLYAAPAVKTGSNRRFRTVFFLIKYFFTPVAKRTVRITLLSTYYHNEYERQCPRYYYYIASPPNSLFVQCVVYIRCNRVFVVDPGGSIRPRIIYFGIITSSPPERILLLKNNTAKNVIIVIFLFYLVRNRLCS